MDPKKTFEKVDTAKSCSAIKNNELKCGYYSILFSILADDNEQHFN